MARPDPSHHLPRWLFLRLLGVIYIAAFASFWVQAHGLVGETGIVPAVDSLKNWAHLIEQRDLIKWLTIPTLGWLSGGDLALHGLCGGGVLAGVLLVLNVAPRLMIGLAWVLYLSLFHLGGPFLSFQWDILLLETSVVAFVLAPSGLRPPLAEEPPVTFLGRWLPRLLLFKLMLSSGLVKLQSGDPTWHDLTALDFHFWTQPLPHGLAWYAHQLPEWAHRASVRFTLVAELIVPPLIFISLRRWGLLVWLAGLAAALSLLDDPFTPLPVLGLVGLAVVLDDRLLRRVAPRLAAPCPSEARLPAFWAFAALMFGINATGNYGFFPVLTLTLCVMLLDDGALRRVLPWRVVAQTAPAKRPRPTLSSQILAWAIGVVWISASLLQMSPLTGRELPEIRAQVLGPLRPFASVNSYGLFARMTTHRWELIIEGSLDGKDWRAYPFKYKPNAPTEIPPFIGLHMPRLDWQMWFAALRPRCPPGGWYLKLTERLLDGEPTVLSLFASNPFPDAPPRQIRTRRVAYRFNDAATRARDQTIWATEPGQCSESPKNSSRAFGND